MLSRRSYHPQRHKKYPTKETPRPTKQKTLNLPHFRQGVYHLTIQSQPSTNELYPITTTPRYHDKPSHTRPKTTSPHTKGQIPSTLHPTRQTNDKAIPHETFQSTLPHPKQSLPNNNETSKTPYQETKHPHANTRSTNLHTTIQTLEHQRHHPYPTPTNNHHRQKRPRRLHQTLQHKETRQTTKHLRRPPHPNLCNNTKHLTKTMSRRHPREDHRTSTTPPKMRTKYRHRPLQLLKNRLPLPHLRGGSQPVSRAITNSNQSRHATQTFTQTTTIKAKVICLVNSLFHFDEGEIERTIVTSRTKGTTRAPFVPGETLDAERRTAVTAVPQRDSITRTSTKQSATPE